MPDQYLSFVQTIGIFLTYILLRVIISKIINNTRAKRLLQEARSNVIRKVLNLILLAVCIISVLLVWGVDHSDLAIVLSSVLTIIGVAFFATWSLLSNITSSIILFFNSPMKIGDSIIIMEDKDYKIEGKIINIGLFFVTISTGEAEELTIPNNVFIQKSIMKITSN